MRPRWLREHLREVLESGVQVVVADSLATQDTTEQADELLTRALWADGLILEHEAMSLTQRRIPGSSAPAPLAALDVGAT
jgi:hypothetical protein